MQCITTISLDSPPRLRDDRGIRATPGISRTPRPTHDRSYYHAGVSANITIEEDFNMSNRRRKRSKRLASTMHQNQLSLAMRAMKHGARQPWMRVRARGCDVVHLRSSNLRDAAYFSSRGVGVMQRALAHPLEINMRLRNAALVSYFSYEE